MTLEEAIQEFEDFCYHHSLHPEISNEALVIALKAMIYQQEQIIKECKNARNNCCRIQGDHLVFGFCDICNYRGGLCDHVEERR